MPEIRVCNKSDLSDGQVRVVRIGDLEIGVVRHAGEFHAFSNYCPHQGGPVCEGLRMPRIVEHVTDQGIYLGQTFDESEMHIVCPWHGYEFRMSDGVHVRDDKVRIKKFPVVTKESDIYVTI
jgi:nitrite reductase (NADH) small subunit